MTLHNEKTPPTQAGLTGYRIIQEAKGEASDYRSKLQIDIDLFSADTGAEKFAELIKDIRWFLINRNEKLRHSHQALDDTSSNLTDN